MKGVKTQAISHSLYRTVLIYILVLHICTFRSSSNRWRTVKGQNTNSLDDADQADASVCPYDAFGWDKQPACGKYLHICKYVEIFT